VDRFAALALADDDDRVGVHADRRPPGVLPLKCPTHFTMLLGVFVALPLGLLGRRFGDRLVLGMGLALMTAGACFSAWADGPAGIALGRTVAGVGALAIIVLQGKIITDWFSGPMFMIGISVSVSAFAVGMGLAQLVLPSLLGWFELSGALLSDAVPAGLGLLLFVASYRSPPHVLPVPWRFALPSRRECLLLAFAGVAWMTYTAGFTAFASYLPASLSNRLNHRRARIYSQFPDISDFGATNGVSLLRCDAGCPEARTGCAASELGLRAAHGADTVVDAGWRF